MRREELEAIAQAVRQLVGTPMEIALCPSLLCNPRCPSDDPCTLGSAATCRWSGEDPWGTPFLCECPCHEQIAKMKP